jgi:hypothetical protein
MFVAYVEQFFAPSMGSRGYSSEIRSYPGLTEDEAKAKAKELRDEWDKQATDRYSFYCSFRKERTAK